MTTPEWILAAVLAGTVALMFGTRLRPDVVALLAALALTLFGVAPEGGALQGMSSTVVLTLLALFILAEGLENTGVIRWAAHRLSGLAGTGEVRLLATLMGTASFFSLGMNNVAVGALLIPASVRVSRSSGVPVSRLLLPISYATLLGGMATIFTTANIIMSDLLEQRGSPPLGMLDFALTGGLVAVTGLLYMLSVGRRTLPPGQGNGARDDDLFGLYRIGERFWEFDVAVTSPLVGKTIEEVAFGRQYGVSVLSIRRRGRTLLVPGPGTALIAGDQVVVLGRRERISEIGDLAERLRPRPPGGRDADELELTEVVVPPRSRAIGSTLAELGLRTRHGITVLALWRQGRVLRTDVGSTPLQAGDGLLVVNLPRRLDSLARTGDFVLTGSDLAAPERPERAPVALAIFALVVAAAFTARLPLGETALAGALAMILTGCLSAQQAYRAVEWHVLLLVAGLLPLGLAMADTGLADRAAAGLVSILGAWPPLLGIGTMFLLSAGATQVIGGQVSAVLVGPVALAVAAETGVAPEPMAVAVAIGASTAFLTPMAHPVNAMMMGTGGYTARDFARAGAGLTLTTLLSLLAGMWLFWGIR